jgi:hypothetical protein
MAELMLLVGYITDITFNSCLIVLAMSRLMLLVEHMTYITFNLVLPVLAMT